MNPDRLREVEAILDAALTRDPGEWPGLLDQSCSGDPDLRREVEALLQRIDTAREFLQSPPILSTALIAEAEEAEAATRETGRRVGPYRIVRRIGQGGMARVFLAERADGEFRQEVALKLLRPGLDSELDRQRFRAERQILATLNHPNIARLLDGGVTEDGQPYLVLEYVEGMPIDAYCRQHGLSLNQRLELFLTVAAATEYAHRSLVIHRDLKPSNVLVTPTGQVKLLDFGLAKLLEPGPSDLETPATRTGQRWMTPEYAAPEQVRGDPVTTLTDVYQLGAVLYQLLTGRVPFAGRHASLHELEEAVLREEPQPPSLAVTPDATGTARALRGDLDAIALKTLQKEPERRYTSVHALTDDVRRHLSGHPVLARHHTAGYLARRFVRRHRLGLATITVILLLLGMYAVTVTLQRERIRRALDEATLGTHRAEQVTDFMLGLFEAAEAGKALTDTVTARELLSRGVAQAREAAGQPALQAQMLDVIGRLYTELGEYDRAGPLLEEALAVRRTLYGENHPDYVTTLQNLADLMSNRLEGARTIELREQVLALRRRISGNTHPKTLDAMWELGTAIHWGGGRTDSSALFQEWMTAVVSSPREISADRAQQFRTAASMMEYRGRLERAEWFLREAMAIQRELYGERHHETASTMSQLGTLLTAQGRKEEGEQLARTAVASVRATYPDGHPTLASALREHAFTLEFLRRWPEAVEPLREALEIRRRFLGPNSIDVAMSSMDLSNALNFNNEYVESEQLARDAIRIFTQELGDASSMTIFAGVHLGEALRGQGRYAEAEPLLLAGFKRFEVPKPVTARWRRHAIAALYRLYEAQGRLEEAARYRALAEPRSVDSSTSR